MISTAADRDANTTQVPRSKTENLGIRRSLPTIGARGNATIHQHTDAINARVRGRVTAGSTTLTSQLSGARPHTNRSCFISTHRFPPSINEDDDARPLQRKLDISR